jgi:hypothetical protein
MVVGSRTAWDVRHGFMASGCSDRAEGVRDVVRHPSATALAEPRRDEGASAGDRVLLVDDLVPVGVLTPALAEIPDQRVVALGWPPRSWVVLSLAVVVLGVGAVLMTSDDRPARTDADWIRGSVGVQPLRSAPRVPEERGPAIGGRQRVHVPRRRHAAPRHLRRPARRARSYVARRGPRRAAPTSLHFRPGSGKGGPAESGPACEFEPSCGSSEASP